MIIEAYNYLQKIIDASTLNEPTQVKGPLTQVISPPTQVIDPSTHMNVRMTSPEDKKVEVKSEIDQVIEEIELDEEDDDFFTENAQISAGTQDVVQDTSPEGDKVSIQEILVHEEWKQPPETGDTGQMMASSQQDNTDRIFKCIECNIILPEPDDSNGSFIHMTRSDKFQNAYANISSKNPVCSSFLICPQCKLKKSNPMPD